MIVADAPEAPHIDDRFHDRGHMVELNGLYQDPLGSLWLCTARGFNPPHSTRNYDVWYAEFTLCVRTEALALTTTLGFGRPVFISPHHGVTKIMADRAHHWGRCMRPYEFGPAEVFVR